MAECRSVMILLSIFSVLSRLAACENFKLLFMTHGPYGYQTYAPAINIAVDDFLAQGRLPGHNVTYVCQVLF